MHVYIYGTIYFALVGIVAGCNWRGETGGGRRARGGERLKHTTPGRRPEENVDFARTRQGFTLAVLLRIKGLGICFALFAFVF